MLGVLAMIAADLCMASLLREICLTSDRFGLGQRILVA